MTFSKGSIVEACRKDQDCLSWLNARVLSGNAQFYKIQYESLLDTKGNGLRETVSSEAVRPVPPVMKGLGKVSVGNWVEVRDNHGWKIATVTATLPGKYFIVMFHGTDREKRCHLLTLRPLLSWENGEWVYPKQVSQTHDSARNVISRKRKLEFQSMDSPVVQPSQKRRMILKDNGQGDESSTSWPGKVVTFSFPKNNMGEEPLDAHFPERLNISNEEAESNSTSVASCSNRCLLHACSAFPLINYLIRDAESSYRYQSKEIESKSKDDIVAKIHQLELDAYRSTLRAFYISGSLNWDKEVLLSDLRNTLGISNDEHLSELRTLSAQIL